MNDRILKLASRFQRILKVAEGTAVSMQLADAQDLLANQVGIIIEGGSSQINMEAPIVKDIIAEMQKSKCSNFVGKIQIDAKKQVYFVTNCNSATNMLKSKYSTVCSRILQSDKRQVQPEGLVWENWMPLNMD